MSVNRIYLNRSVYEEAKDRIRWLFDEFDNVIVNFSGGKDSTTTLYLALEVAEEKNRLPLKVMFLDQEAEWQTVIDYIREVFADPRVDPVWLQVPIKLFNATSADEPWLMCWEDGREHMRELEPNAITENIYGTDRFAEFFGAYLKHHYPDESAVCLAGVRCEESPGRLLGLTNYETYKGETWGKIRDKVIGHYDFYPLYDWSYTDVWKAIHDNGWPYCKIYDYQYKYGVKVSDMRVSNLHHETSIHALYYLQEIERETWNKLTKRLKGINTAGQLKKESFTVKDLPFMFESWKEYRDYLLQKLPSNDETREIFRKEFESNDASFKGMPSKDLDRMMRLHIASLLTNDFHLTKIHNFIINGNFVAFRRIRAGKEVQPKHAKALINGYSESDQIPAWIKEYSQREIGIS